MNPVSQNISTLYTIASDTDTIPVVTGNNIVNNGAGFYLGNTGATQISVNSNWFGTTDQAILLNNIDGDVDYTMPATAIITDPVPLSPPTNFNIVQNGDTVTMTWDAPVETDLAGFIVYWGNSAAPIYGNSQDVGLSQSFTVADNIDSTQNYYFAVTAYDADIGTVNDDPATLINEKQISGHESWFSDEAVVLGTVVNSGGGGGGGGGSVAWWSILMLLALRIFRHPSIQISRS